VISDKLGAGQYEDAFQACLDRQDPGLAVWTCRQVDPGALLAREPCPLSQAVLASLLSQLSYDLSRWGRWGRCWCRVGGLRTCVFVHVHLHSMTARLLHAVTCSPAHLPHRLVPTCWACTLPPDCTGVGVSTPRAHLAASLGLTCLCPCSRSDTDLKLQWVMEAAQLVNPKDPALAGHIKAVLQHTLKGLKGLMASASGEAARQCKLAAHLINSLLHQ
jgi:hypothetical protein